MSRSRRCPISPKTLPSSDSKIGEDDDIDEVTTRGERENDADVDDRWSSMLPELLTEIIKRVEASEDKWPMRKSVVACACVCKRWRQTTMEIVRPPVECGRITFPSHLKQSATREAPVQCFIKRNAKNSTFLLYLSLTAQVKNLASTGVGKFLLAAKRTRRGGRFEYVISLDADDFSQGSNAYLGKLRSDFLGTKFTIYDSQPPFEGAKASSRRASRRFSFKQVSPSPQVSAGNFEIGNLSYKFNILKSRGPRRMACSLQFPPNLESSPTMNDILNKSNTKSPICNSFAPSSLVLKNKAPRWHEHLQCWCLNFHGRVTVASVKNFQLVASVDPSQPGNVGDEEMVLLQFGKVGDDLFTMDYRQPLSAFQAFTLCLTSFGTKFACE